MSNLHIFDFFTYLKKKCLNQACKFIKKSIYSKQFKNSENSRNIYL